MENDNEKRRRLYKEYLDALNRYLEAAGAPFRATPKGMAAYEITGLDASELSPGDRDLLEKMKLDVAEKQDAANKKPAFDADAFRDAVREKVRSETMFAGVADLAEKIANGKG